MLAHHLTGSASERWLADEHRPEGHAQRVKIRADVYADPDKLLGTGKLWCSGESPRR